MVNPRDPKAKTAAIAPFGLRMHGELKRRIDAAAAANGRSANSEICARLERSFTEENAASDRQSELAAKRLLTIGMPGPIGALQAQIDELRGRLAQIEGRLHGAETQAEETQADERPPSLNELHGGKRLIE